uniref:Tetratricopeptide repeat protein n=1 Tax=Solibacter usitatus (strain Ellin6076) TaxID=234267 RepID=Q024I4_SOLUE
MKVAALALLLAACGSAPESRQFDFWLGDWDVQVAGKIVARSKIQSIADGCIILENWMPFSGGQGKSWNFRNPATGQWEQLWITDTGEILKLSGHWKDGAIRQSNATHRHSFTPVAPGRVHQFCEESRDGGKTWQVVFDALYIKRE